MEKEDVLRKANLYSKSVSAREAYIAGFQACCTIIRKDMNQCYNDEFLTKMEELADISYIYFERK